MLFKNLEDFGRFRCTALKNLNYHLRLFFINLWSLKIAKYCVFAHKGREQIGLKNPSYLKGRSQINSKNLTVSSKQTTLYVNLVAVRNISKTKKLYLCAGIIKTKHACSFLNFDYPKKVQRCNNSDITSKCFFFVIWIPTKCKIFLKGIFKLNEVEAENNFAQESKKIFGPGLFCFEVFIKSFGRL